MLSKPLVTFWFLFYDSVPLSASSWHVELRRWQGKVTGYPNVYEYIMRQPNVVTRLNELVQSMDRPFVDLVGRPVAAGEPKFPGHISLELSFPLRVLFRRCGGEIFNGAIAAWGPSGNPAKFTATPKENTKIPWRKSFFVYNQKIFRIRIWWLTSQYSGLCQSQLKSHFTQHTTVNGPFVSVHTRTSNLLGCQWCSVRVMMISSWWECIMWQSQKWLNPLLQVHSREMNEQQTAVWTRGEEALVEVNRICLASRCYLLSTS